MYSANYLSADKNNLVDLSHDHCLPFAHRVAQIQHHEVRNTRLSLYVYVYEHARDMSPYVAAFPLKRLRTVEF